VLDGDAETAVRQSNRLMSLLRGYAEEAVRL
jgi:hypothetical protein